MSLTPGTSGLLAAAVAPVAAVVSFAPEAKPAKSKKPAARVVMEMDDDGKWSANVTVNRALPLGPIERRHALRTAELALKENKRAAFVAQVDAETSDLSEEPVHA